MPDERELIDGVQVRMGGKTWTIPPLNLRLLKKYRETLEGLGSVNPATEYEKVETMVDIIHASMKRNYPELTVGELEEMLDLATFVPAVNAIMAISGFKPAGESEAGSR